MKRTELGIVKFAIAPTDELAPLGIDEPLVYWRAGIVRVSGLPRHTLAVYSSERAAWIARENYVKSACYEISADGPFQCTRYEVNAVALNSCCHTVHVYDEFGTVVDSWTVTA